MSSANGGGTNGGSHLPFCTACGTANTSDEANCASCGASTARSSQFLDDSTIRPIPVLRGSKSPRLRPSWPVLVGLPVLVVALGFLGFRQLTSERQPDIASGSPRAEWAKVDGTYTGTMHGAKCDYDLTLTLTEVNRQVTARAEQRESPECGGGEAATEILTGTRGHEFSLHLKGQSWATRSPQGWKLDEFNLNFDQGVRDGFVQSFGGNFNCPDCIDATSHELEGSRQQPDALEGAQ